MLVNEFISQVEKDNIITTLLKHYKVGNIRIRYQMINDYAHYDVDRGILNLSSKYKTIKPRQMKDFLITMLHEIKHAMDARKYGWRKFKEMYEIEMNMITQGHYPGKDDPYKDNKYEIEAEEFGQKNWKQWYNKFK